MFFHIKYARWTSLPPTGAEQGSFTPPACLKDPSLPQAELKTEPDIDSSVGVCLSESECIKVVNVCVPVHVWEEE